MMDNDIFKKRGLPPSALEEAARALGPQQTLFLSVFEEQARLTQQLDPSAKFIAAAAAVTAALGTRSAVDDMIGATGVGLCEGLIAQTTPALTALGAVNAVFQRPELDALHALQNQLSTAPYTDILERYSLETGAVAAAMEAMRSPWLDTHNKTRSITAFTELHGIGHALATLPSFDDHLTLALRDNLGDWRGPLMMDLTALRDPTVRRHFYVERGFDTALTEFLPEALRDGLQSAGLYEPEAGVEDGENVEAGFMRTNEAHDILMRFEYHLRAFIDATMTKAFGPHWIRQRVPENVRTNWEDKRDEDRAAKRAERKLIEYSAFTDYLPIITRNDNWKEVFGEIFVHKSSVEESFRRLYPVRNCVMHAVLLTPDDALFLLFEVKRLKMAFGI